MLPVALFAIGELGGGYWFAEELGVLLFGDETGCGAGGDCGGGSGGGGSGGVDGGGVGVGGFGGKGKSSSVRRGL